MCASKVDFKKLYLLSDLYVYIEQAVHCFLKSALSLGDNLAGSWDISRNLPISWTRNWDKLIFSVHFQNLDRESESSNISRDRLKHTDYLGPSQQGENCFLNQPGFNKPWIFFSRVLTSRHCFTARSTLLSLVNRVRQILINHKKNKSKDSSITLYSQIDVYTRLFPAKFVS